MTKQDPSKPTREEIFREKAKSYIVCYSQNCPIRENCLRNILKDYVPDSLIAVTCINLGNPQTQRSDCPKYRHDEPVRMPVGLSRMYYDMPGRLERAIKNHLINVFSRKRYYEYHGGKRPITPQEEQLIRQTLKDFGWEQEPIFDDYIEEYLW